MTAHVSRRTLLAVGLGASFNFQLAGCSPQSDVLQGAYTHELQSRGHLLRATKNSQHLARVSKTTRTRTLILGGGVAGLAAARALRFAGRDDFLLLELADSAGGNARGAQLQGLVHPLGAHYLPVPSEAPHDAPHVKELLEELGLRRRVSGRWEYDERHVCHSPQERLNVYGEWHTGLLPPHEVSNKPNTLAQYQRFGTLVGQWQRTGAFTLPLKTLGSAAALHTFSFAEYLQREGLDDPQLLWYLDYCCKDDYGAGLAVVSAFAGIHYFAARHGFNPPNEANNANSLADAEKPAVLTWPEGNGHLTARMASPLGERLKTGRVVLGIADGKHAVEVTAHNVHTQSTERFEAQRVVCALPAFVVARLLEGAPTALTRRATLTPYAGWQVSHLLLHAPLEDGFGSGAQMAWDNVVFDPNWATHSAVTRSLGYVNAQHQTTLPHAAASVLTHYSSAGVGLAQRRALYAQPWEAAAARVVQELKAVHPDLPSKLARLDITRYGHAMAVPLPGQPLGQRPPQLPRIAFAHSDWAGYSVFEEAFEMGHAAGVWAARA